MSRIALSLPACALCAACTADGNASLETVARHACLHAEHGPFRDAPASTDLQGTVSGIDTPHVAYRVALPAGTDGHLGALRYQPRHTARYAFLTDSAPGLVLRGDDGGEIELVDDTAVAGCPMLAHAVTAELTAGAAYRVVVGPTSITDVLLVVENIDEIAP